MFSQESKPQTILISGATGLIGTQLANLLAKKGYKILQLSRRRNLNTSIPTYEWNIDNQTIDLEAIAQADAIIHLAGANVAEKRWTQKVKQNIIHSRTQSIALLNTALQSVPNRVKTFIGASAVGIYGNAGNLVLYEDDKPTITTLGDQSFLSQTTQQWEAAYQKMAAENPQLRMAIFRIGVVLAKEGGALAKILLPTRLGISNYFGNGQQIMPWIHHTDLCRMMQFACENPNLYGTFNAVAPNPVSNQQFAKILPQVLRQHAWVMPIPAIVLKIVMGQMAEIVLHGCNPSAQKIQKAGFQFMFSELPAALSDLLKR